MSFIVQLKEVSKHYGSGNTRVDALSKVSFSLAAAEFAAIAGPSGSGKSTILNLICGLDRPNSGEIVIDSTSLSGLKESELSTLRLNKIGFVFQSYNLLPVLTCYENAEYVLMLRGVPQKDRKDRVMSMLETVGLGGLEDRYPRELSGGQQQRVAIARAVVAEPALVLADEPTANLDSRTGTALIDLMTRLNQEKGVTFLFSSHDQAVLERVSRVIRLHDGELSEDSREQRKPVD